MLLAWISAIRCLKFGTLDVFSDLAIPECSFKSDELPLLESFGELTRSPFQERHKD